MSLFLWEDLQLVHIIVIYHTISFHMSNHTDSRQLASQEFNCYEKIITVSGLCLTYVILFILIHVLGLFISQTTFNDPCLIQFILYLTKMIGK